MAKEAIAKEQMKQHEMVLLSHGYKPIHPLGKGGYATVFLVESMQYHCNFAVKVSQLSRENSHVEFQELELLKGICHPNIIRPYDYFQEKSHVYAVLEYCENGSLHDLIKKRSIPFEECLRYMTEIASAVNACHKAGMAHRDIKPLNVLISAYGHAKLADFGLGIISETNSLVPVSACSLAFSPPELFDHRAIDPFKGDIWSLGVMFYNMITGQLPWSMRSKVMLMQSIKEGVQYFDESIPYSMRKLILQMMALDPNDRITAEKVLEALRAMKIDAAADKGQMNLASAPRSLTSSEAFLKFTTGQPSAEHSGERKRLIKSFGLIGIPGANQRVNDEGRLNLKRGHSQVRFNHVMSFAKMSFPDALHGMSD